MNVWFIALQFVLVVGARGCWDEFVGLRGAALEGGEEAHDDTVLYPSIILTNWQELLQPPQSTVILRQKIVQGQSSVHL
jgi:hypothetical protein